MSADERERLLKDAGRWREVPPGPRRDPAFVTRQKELLRKVSALLEEQIRQDHAAVAELQEKVSRLKHGGGV